MRSIAFSALVLALCVPASAQTNPAPSVRLLSAEPGDAFGFTLAPAGDVDGDGRVDLVVGAPSSDAGQQFAGRAYLFRSPLAATSTVPAAAAATLSTTLFGDNLGSSVASAGDVDGDGLDDVLVGARGSDAGGIQSGRVYLFRGPVTERVAAGAHAVITGLPFDEIGRIVAPAGDLDGDGFDDFIVGSDIAGPGRTGRLYVFHGPVSGALTVADADAVLVGALPDDFFGTSVSAPGDLSGDGVPDLVVGASRLIALGDTNGPGRVFVFHGPFSGTVNAGSAQAVLTGELLNDAFGQSVATGDVNGDGVKDLVVGAHQFFRTDGTGRAYVFHGPVTGAVAAASAQAIVRGDAVGLQFGTSVAVADLDQDGRGDVVVGAPGPAGSRVFAYRSPLAGSVAASSAGFAATAPPSDALGMSLAVVDVNGDGRPDVVTAGPAASNDAAPTYVVAFTNALPPVPVRRPAPRGTARK